MHTYRVKRVRVFKHERQMKVLLDSIYPDAIYIDNKRYKCLGGLELDRYYPILRLAFEYNGEQHYYPVFGRTYAKATKQYQQQARRDIKKVKMCKVYNIKLVVIPYWIKLTRRNILRCISRTNVGFCRHLRANIH